MCIVNIVHHAKCYFCLMSYVSTCRSSNTGLFHYMGQHNPKNATPTLWSNISEKPYRNSLKCHTNMSNDLLFHLICSNPSSGSLHVEHFTFVRVVLFALTHAKSPYKRCGFIRAMYKGGPYKVLKFDIGRMFLACLILKSAPDIFVLTRTK